MWFSPRGLLTPEAVLELTRQGPGHHPLQSMASFDGEKVRWRNSSSSNSRKSLCFARYPIACAPCETADPCSQRQSPAK